MVNNTAALNNIFYALGDTTRRAILKRLTQDDALVSELAAPFAISLPAISKHLRVLERAGLITRIKNGRNCRCQLRAVRLREAAEWIHYYRSFWETPLDSFEQYLESNQCRNRKEKLDDDP